MKVRIVVINEGPKVHSCEVYEHVGDRVKIEVTEEKEPTAEAGEHEAI